MPNVQPMMWIHFRPEGGDQPNWVCREYTPDHSKKPPPKHRPGVLPRCFNYNEIIQYKTKLFCSN